ncbi:MAG TPA: SMC family ATPase [Nitrososphaerales archaeon]|nr:SMC family ATPase [Nitrososphaerales archaeon]
MKLISLYASNFKKLDFDAPLRFKDGITVISGLNEAGKSTILDAVLYALYGRVTKPPGHAKDEDLLAYTTNRAKIVLEFTIGEELYKVTREIRRAGTNKAILEEHIGEDRWKVTATKSREVTASITSLLGSISFDEMVSSTIVAQKDLDRLVQQGSDRWKVINAFLHLESFNQAVEELNEERKDLEGTGPSRPGLINTQRDKLAELSRDLQEYERRELQNLTLKEETTRLQGEVEIMTTKYKELDALHNQLIKYDEMSTLRQNALAEAQSKQAQLDSHRRAVATYRRQVEEAQEELAKYSDLPSDQGMTKISDLVSAVQSEDFKIGRLNELDKTVSAEVTSLQAELSGYDRSAIEKSKASRGSLMPYAGGSASAFVVAVVSFALSVPILPWVAVVIGFVLLFLLGRNISKMSKLVKLQGLLGRFELYEGKTKELKSLREDLSKLEGIRTDSINALSAGLASVPRYSEVGVDIEPLDRASMVLKQFSLDVQKKGSAESSAAKLRRGLTELEGQVDESSLTKQISDLRANAESIILPSLPTGVEFSKDLLNDVTVEKEEVGRKISGNQAKIESDNRTVLDNEQYMTDHKNIRTDLESQRTLVDKLERGLKIVKAAKDGIEATAESRRDRFRPGVETYMGEILPSLTSGRYKAVMLGEDFGVQVFDPEAGEYRPKDVFSGGTEDQFLLAMRLAFALALIPEAKGATPQFLWLDEPLGSSDETRRSGIVEYLSINLSRLFSQIFIVSHVGGLEEQVANIIRLEDGKPQI